MALLHIDHPNTVEGKALKLTPEQEKNCKVLYRKIEENLYEFAGLYNPDIADEDYPDGLIALPLSSTYGGTTNLSKEDSVWNVIGSSGDFWNGKVCHDWIGVWQGYAPGYSKKCYVKGSRRTKDGKTDCGTTIVGGHVITSELQPTYGDDGKVYIVPICNRHNNCNNHEKMTICESVKALVLNRYHLEN